MRRITVVSLVAIVAILVTLGGCQLFRSTPQGGTQVIVVGESFVSGSEAVQEANNFVTNAAACGCRAISVGGYGAGGEALVFGVPVLLDCPSATTLLPDGTCP